jgi:hypothetical protein
MNSEKYIAANSGITVQNTAGRMVEAYTNNDCNGTTNVVTTSGSATMLLATQPIYGN